MFYKHKGISVFGVTVILLVIIVLLIVGGAFGGDDDETGSSEPASSSPEQTQTKETKADIPKEYESALNKAETYSDMMYMSKAAIYDQLVSKDGEQFTQEEADYALEHLNE